jgi:predicted GNAT family acetyltransferase
MDSSLDDVRVVDNPGELQYELWVNGACVGMIAYRLRPGVRTLIHTELDPAFQDRGLGSTLVSGALEDIRDQGLAVAPICPFVHRFLRKHPEYEDLVVASAPLGRI